MTDSDNNILAGWAFSQVDIRHAIENGHLLNPSIDLSNPCNLNCPYCFTEEKNSERKLRYPNELSIEEIQVILQDMVSCGAKSINIVGAGEPTIDPHFENIVEEISELGATPIIFTNGIFLADRPNLVDLLYKIGASVVIKCDSLQNNLQDLFAGRTGYSVQRNLAIKTMFNRGFNSHKPTRLGFDTIVCHGNLDEIAEIYIYCRQNNIFPIVTEFIPTGRTEHGKFAGHAAIKGLSEEDKKSIITLLKPLTQTERSSLYQILLKIDLDRFGVIHHKSPAYFNGSPCTQLLGIYVDIHGDLWPCVARSIRQNSKNISGLLGNTREGLLPSDAWRNHPYLKKIRISYSGACPYKVAFC